MAVKRVFGTVNGTEVVMDHAYGDVWQVPVPMDKDGEYVVEVIAEDEAGNRSYLAKMLFAVNTALLCVHVAPLPFYGSLMAPGHDCSVAPAPYHASLQPRRFRAEALRGLYGEVLEAECCLERRQPCRKSIFT